MAARTTGLAAGDLWTRVSLQEIIPGPEDAYGSRQLVPVVRATVWADVEEISGREVWYGQQVQPETTHGVTIRLWDGGSRPRLTSSWQLLWGIRTLEIESAVNDFGRGKTRLMCKESVPSPQPDATPIGLLLALTRD